MKKSFLSGAFLLVITGIISKFIGAFYRIPLGNMIGSEGMAYYQAAYPVYSLMLVLSISGLPTAVSKLVAEKLAIGKGEAAKRVFVLSFLLMFFLGSFFTVLMFLFAPQISSYIGMEKAVYTMLAIAPSLLFASLVAALRGYFQGMLKMLPTAMSQLTEQIVRLIAGLYLSFRFVRHGPEYGAAGAALGVSISELAGLLCISIAYLIKRKAVKDNFSGKKGQKEDSKELLRRIVRIAFPITVGACVIPIVNAIDSFLVIKALTKGGRTVQEAASLFGLLTGFALPVANMPGILTSSLASAVVPALSANHAAGREKSAFRQAKLCIYLGFLAGLPSAFGCYYVAENMLKSMYPKLLVQELSVCTGLLKMLSPSVLMLSLFQSMTGVLQGVGRADIPVKGLVLGAFAKIGSSYILMQCIGIYGAAAGTLACYFTASLYTGLHAIKILGIREGFLKRLAVPALASWLMGICCSLIQKCITGSPIKSLVISVLAGIAIYAILIFISKALTLDELFGKKLYTRSEKNDKAHSRRNGYRKPGNDDLGTFKCT